MDGLGWRHLQDEGFLKTFFENEKGLAIVPTNLRVEASQIVVDGEPLSEPTSSEDRIAYAELAHRIAGWVADAWSMKVESASGDPAYSRFHRRWREARDEVTASRERLIELRDSQAVAS